MSKHFSDILQLIQQSRNNTIKLVNTELINLYWSIGEYVSKKIEHAEWGDSIVKEIARHIQIVKLNLKGFSDKNIWRMVQFYDSYKSFPKVSPVVREISWSNNLLIF